MCLRMQVQVIVLNLKSKDIDMNANELIRGHCEATGTVTVLWQKCRDGGLILNSVKKLVWHLHNG